MNGTSFGAGRREETRRAKRPVRERVRGLQEAEGTEDIIRTKGQTPGIIAPETPEKGGLPSAGVRRF